MSEADEQAKPIPFIAVTGRQIVGTIVIGAVAGLVSWGLAVILGDYVLRGIFCQATITEQCAATAGYSWGAGMVLATVIAVFALVRLQVFRPLLVGVCVMVSLWSVASVLTELPVYLAALLFAGLFAVAYLAFMWIARLRSFGMAVLLMIVLVVIVRLALNS
jgi:hypothetical protein